MLRVYGFFLHLYPPAFRLEFEAEMRFVFAQAASDAARQGWRVVLALFWRELTHLFAGALVERLTGWKKPGVKNMIENSASSPASQSTALQVEPSASALTILLGLFPILLLALGTLLIEIPVDFLWNGLVGTPILYLVVLVAAGIAWYHGSPRWSYSFTGFLLVFTWYLEGFKPPSFIASWVPYLRYGELWGKWIWIPLLLTWIIVLLARRSWKPLKEFFQNIRTDWTLYTFLFYSTMPWLCWALFDEIHAKTLVVVSLLIADLSLVLGAFFFLKARTISRGAVALFLGFIPAIFFTVIPTAIYWHGVQEFWMAAPGNGYLDALRGFIFFAVILLILFFPALVAVARRKIWRLRST